MLDPDAADPLVAETARLAERGQALAESTAATRDMIREMLAAKGVSAPEGARPAAPDPVAELERLGALRERGLLTDEEFAAERRGHPPQLESCSTACAGVRVGVTRGGQAPRAPRSLTVTARQ